MNALKKTLLIIAAIFLVVLLLTVIGVVTQSDGLIAFIGLALHFVFFLFFVQADKLAAKIKRLQDLGFFRGTELQKIASIIQKISLHFALIVRSVFLSLSHWVVEFYLSLNDKGLAAFFDQIWNNILFSIISISLAAIDTTRGKSLEKQGLPTRIISIIGFFLFFKNFIILFASASSRMYRPMEKLFSNPIWFLFDSSYKYEILRMAASLELTFILLVFSIFLFGGAIGMFSKPKDAKSIDARNETDAKNAGIALLVISCWLATVPIYEICSLIQYFSKK